jgi:hypothetical protein
MSAGIGYYNKKSTNVRMRQELADKRNAEMGLSDPNYYDDFENYVPEKEKPQNSKGIFEENPKNVTIMFEDGKNVSPFKPKFRSTSHQARQTPALKAPISAGPKPKIDKTS